MCSSRLHRRYVFRLHRQRVGAQADQLEDWVDFVKRTAHRVDTISENAGMEDWVRMYRRRKWRFAGITARRQDNRWSKLILSWRPNFGVGRSRGAPVTRWSDQLEKFAGGEWMQLAADIAQWEDAEDVFAGWGFARRGL